MTDNQDITGDFELGVFLFHSFSSRALWEITPYACVPTTLENRFLFLYDLLFAWCDANIFVIIFLIYSISADEKNKQNRDFKQLDF